MRILLTRARPDAERTAARLAALGHESIFSPVIEIVATGAALPLGPFDAVIATSAHAFTGGMGSLVNIPLYAVGERTREAAERAQWIAAIHVGETAKALTTRLRDRFSEGQRVLYLAGRDRKPDIEAAAQEIGLDLQTVETCVAREISSLTEKAERALRTGEVDAVLHYSRRSVELFVAIVRRAELWAQAARVGHYALSDDVAEPLIGAGAHIIVAAAADEDHLLALLPRENPR